MKIILLISAAFFPSNAAAGGLAATAAKGVVLIPQEFSIPAAASIVPGLNSPGLADARPAFESVLPRLLDDGPVVAATNGVKLLLLSATAGRAAVIGLSPKERIRPRIRVLSQERLEKVKKDLLGGDVWQAHLSMNGVFDGYRASRSSDHRPRKIVTPRDASVASFISRLAPSDLKGREEYIRKALARVETTNGKKLVMRELKIGRRIRENRVPVSREAALNLSREKMDGILYAALMKARPARRFVVGLGIEAHGQAELRVFAMGRPTFSIEATDSPVGFIAARHLRHQLVSGTVDDLIALMQLPGVRFLRSRRP